MQSRARIIAGLVTAVMVGVFGPTLIAVAHHSGSGAGTISGTVLSAETGDPLWDRYCVTAWFARDSQIAADEIFAGSTQTDDDGVYTLSKLPVDSYKVEFHPCGSRRMGGVRLNGLLYDVLPEFWNEVRTYDEATAIVVGPSQRVTGIDAAIDSII